MTYLIELVEVSCSRFVVNLAENTLQTNPFNDGLHKINPPATYRSSGPKVPVTMGATADSVFVEYLAPSPT